MNMNRLSIDIPIPLDRIRPVSGELSSGKVSQIAKLKTFELNRDTVLRADACIRHARDRFDCYTREVGCPKIIIVGNLIYLSLKYGHHMLEHNIFGKVLETCQVVLDSNHPPMYVRFLPDNDEIVKNFLMLNAE